MGFPLYTNVSQLKGGMVSFEKYLEQIHRLYPNLPDMYVNYLRKIYQFDVTQAARLLTLDHFDLADELISSYINVLEQLKASDYYKFIDFTGYFGYEDRIKTLFDLFPEEPEEPEEPEDTGGSYDLVAYLELVSFSITKRQSIFLSEPCIDLLSIAFSHPHISYDLVQTDGYFTKVVATYTGAQPIDTPVTMYATVLIEEVGDDV